jgi:membrane-associated phospholipid phosphatase
VSAGRRRFVLVVAALYALLGLLVVTHLTDPFDAAVRQWFRPDDVWGVVQLRADRVVETLSPPHVAPVLVLGGLLASAKRRSWVPLLRTLQVGAGVLVLVCGSQLVLARPDTHGEVATLSGSYPSGHTAAVLAAFGGCVLAWSRAPRWWVWVPIVLVDLVMGACLLLEAAHWATDVLGGLLASALVLGVVHGRRDHEVTQSQAPAPVLQL